jgi:hypothetical protein
LLFRDDDSVEETDDRLRPAPGQADRDERAR